jgi:hypothetical protein
MGNGSSGAPLDEKIDRESSICAREAAENTNDNQ